MTLKGQQEGLEVLDGSSGGLELHDLLAQDIEHAAVPSSPAGLHVSGTSNEDKMAAPQLDDGLALLM